LAGFGDRFLAYLIDGLILALVSMVLICPLAIFIVVYLVNNPEPDADQAAGMILFALVVYAAVIVIQFAASYLYFVEYQLRTGQTVGKRVMALRVLPVSGRPLDRAALVRRYLVQVVAGGFIPFFSLVDGLWQLWDQPLQQTLHDKAAETVVAKVVQ
jgi:uncharacterized RDD family membrane protein YckC